MAGEPELFEPELLVSAVMLAVVPVFPSPSSARALVVHAPEWIKGVGLEKEGENLAGFFHNMAPSAEPWGARRDRPSGRARGGEQSSPPSVGGISF